MTRLHKGCVGIVNHSIITRKGLSAIECFHAKFQEVREIYETLMEETGTQTHTAVTPRVYFSAKDYKLA
jgi:hypothetical protein